MNNYKIKVNNEAESKEAQDLFEQLGFKWAGDHPGNGDWYSHLYAENSICCYLSPYVWGGLVDRFKEITLSQLRDLVVLHRKDVKDATHTDGERKGFLSSDGVEYFWNAYDLEWFKPKQMTFAYEKFKPIQEQGLISGADALRALADGKEVQCTITGKNDWTKDIYGIQPYYFLGGGVGQFQFRLKPRTITLNVEIPACGKNYKRGQLIWILNSLEPNEYCSVILDESGELPAYWWETEEQVKQVVAALRGGIKG